MKQRLLVILSLIGIGISLYLVMKTHDPATVICSIGGGCEKVLSSQYAKLYGLPVAGLGVVWYLFELILVWFTYFQRILPNTYVKIWAVAGLLFSLYLLSLEALKIHSYCTWCLTSLAAVVLINIVTFATKSKAND